MRKIKYFILSLFVGTLGMIGANAAELTHSIDVDVTKKTNSDELAVEVVVKNSDSEGAGLKDGKVYVYFDENIVKSVQSPFKATYRDYDEDTGEFTESNTSCSYDGANHRVICSFGRTDTTHNYVNYSDSNDEIIIEFDITLCENSTNCDIKVEVFGASTQFSRAEDGDTIENVERTPNTKMTKNFDCDSNPTNPEPSDPDPSDPTPPNDEDEPTYEPDENPDTFDNGVMYMLFGTLSLILIAAVIVVNKKKKLA